MKNRCSILPGLLSTKFISPRDIVWGIEMHWVESQVGHLGVLGCIALGISSSNSRRQAGGSRWEAVGGGDGL